MDNWKAGAKTQQMLNEADRIRALGAQTKNVLCLRYYNKHDIRPDSVFG